MRIRSVVVVCFALLGLTSATAAPLGTAFTYQGRLNDGTNPASGNYDFRFAIYEAVSGGSALAGPLTIPAVNVAEGLFTTPIDFGANVFTNEARWLEIAVCTNGAGAFVTLLPRQPVTPNPYALYAPSAGHAASANTAAIATNAATAASATSFTGPLAGEVTGPQGATLVASVGGQSAANVASGASAANGAASVNTANAIVKRDGSGGFVAGPITATSFAGDGTGLSGVNADLLDGQHGAFYQNAANLTAGTLADGRLSANVARLDAPQTFAGSNAFNGVVRATNVNNTIVGTFSGNGSGLSGLNGAGLTAGSVGGAALQGNSVMADKIAGSQVVKSLNALKDDVTLAAGANVTLATNGNTLQISATAGSSGWNLAGNGGTTPGVNFLGTTDGQPLELKVNGQRGLRLEPNGTATPNVVGGFRSNLVAAGVSGASIAGGGGTNQVNSVQASFGSIGGGAGNTVQPDAAYSAVGGGAGNAIQSSANYGTIAGGADNQIQANTANGAIGGGVGNTIQVGAHQGMIGGGSVNVINASAHDSVVSGGANNHASSAYATVPGGQANEAAGAYSFAAGRRAKANQGSFVWADSTDADFVPSGTDQFAVRAHGGVWFQTGLPGVTMDGPLQINGLLSGATLDATSLTTGTIPDARLSGNVAMRASGNTFTGNQVLSGNQLINGDLVIDVGNLNNGTLEPGVIFGSPSREGIASQRTPGDNQYGLDFYTGFNKRLSIAQSGDIAVYLNTIFLSWMGDQNHGLGWYGSGKTFADAAPNGPVLFGYSGGALGTTAGRQNIALSWDASGNVGIGTPTPQAKLEVNGDLRAGTFHGDGSGLTNVTAATLAIPPGMALIPAGAFMMGDTLDGESDAVPTGPVTVSAFYMDVNLVSYSQWKSVYYWATSHGYSFAHPGAGKAANHPVQTVDWYDCVKWCNARSEQAGRTPVYYTDPTFMQVYRTGEVAPYANWAANGYRLPTEAEWEKAARGGLSGQRFPWGNVIDESLANYYGDTTWYSYDLGPNGPNAIGSIGGTDPATSPVGSFAANGYGLYDMAGNVGQWCWDWYGTSYAGGTDPRGLASGSYRVLRGGFWYFGAGFCRTANRDDGNPAYGDFDIGFRSVLPSGQ